LVPVAVSLEPFPSEDGAVCGDTGEVEADIPPRK